MYNPTSTFPTPLYAVSQIAFIHLPVSTRFSKTPFRPAQALGKETQATQIATQRARDESANLLNLQQQQINQTASLGFGSADRAKLYSQAQQELISNTLKNILAQRQGAQQQGFSLLAGLPIQPSQQSKSSSSAMGVELAGGVFGGQGGGANATT